MTSQLSDSSQQIYRWAVWLLIVSSVAVMASRIAAVRAGTGETPMLSANDRSRWCTIRALAEDGTYVIDRLVQIRHPETNRRFWKSIDMVRHRGSDGREHYYSSKPPLFSTLLAGQYWLIRAVTGSTLENDPFFVMRLMLVLTNVLPLVLYFVLLAGLVERVTDSNAARLYVMSAATWGTFITTFAVTINNHLVAAVAVLLATMFIFHIWLGNRSWWYFAGAGLCSAFAAANELPALSFFGLIGLAAAWKSPRLTAVAWVPAAALVVAGFVGTNYLSHGSVIPPYAHRSDGPVVAVVPSTVAEDLRVAEDSNPLRPPPSVREALATSGIELSEQAQLLVYRDGERWGIWDRVGHKRFAVVMGPGEMEIRNWGNWYDYPGSYWTGQRQGVDRGEASRLVYAFHVLVGHHGILLLTPIWLFSVVGVILLWRDRQHATSRALAGMVTVLTVVCLAFYLSRPVIDRNYGGVSCGFRWMFWFSPLWLLCMAPAAARVLRYTGGRIFALLLLAVSVFSASFAAANPWSHPWLLVFGNYAGWWSY